MTERVLVVEDDEEIGVELTQAVTGHGFTAQWMCDGRSALAEVAAAPPALILLCAICAP